MIQAMGSGIGRSRGRRHSWAETAGRAADRDRLCSGGARGGWFQQHDRDLLRRINLLIKDTLRSPFDGAGKPEPLKADLAGFWSRRINDEHRLVYEVSVAIVVRGFAP